MKLRILIHAYPFHPSVGGIERVTVVLAQAFHQAGHMVTVVTWTASDKAEEDDARRFPFGVVRRPSWQAARSLAKKHDVLLQNNLSLRLLWPTLGCIPTVLTAHTWVAQNKSSWRTHLKHLAYRSGRRVAVSKALARTLPPPCEVIHNPLTLDADSAPTEARVGLLYVGRLVSDKGVDVLLRAFAQIEPEDIPHLTLIGTGPEKADLQALVEEHSLHTRVRFAGMLEGADLRKAYATHEILAIPSRWDEPFGLIALEGLAAGCRIVASASGGLPEAVGSCGDLVTELKPETWAEALRKTAQKGPKTAKEQTDAKDHLSQFSVSKIIEQYESLFHRLVTAQEPARQEKRTS